MKSKQTDKAVERYRIRRYNRLKARFDADDEESNVSNSGGGSGGHGNTKIPFGLCQREGIKIQPGWTPKDAWKALEGKGYSAGAVYEELKKTGKAGKGMSSGSKSGATKVKRPPTKIEESAFPPGMVEKAFKKNTMAAVNYINDHCDDGDITDFLASGMGDGAVLPPVFKCKRDTDGSGCALSSYYSTISGKIAEVGLKVPMLSAYKTEEEKAGAVRAFAHEWTHYLDKSANGWERRQSFSGSNQKLKEALSKDTEIAIGKESQGLIDEFNRQYKEEKTKYQDERNNVWKKVVDDFYDGKVPPWLYEDGSYNWSEYFKHRGETREYEKRLRKYERQCDSDWNRKKSSFMDGVCELQGCYDALYKGKCRAQGIVMFGHSESYFASVEENQAMELLADYVALRATNPRLAQVFANDKPEIAAALDECIVDMTKKMRGGR